MPPDEPSEGFVGLASHGREMAEAYGVEVQVEELLNRPHRLPRPLSDSRRRGTEPVGELVLQRVPDDDDPFLRQVEGNAALGMSGKVDHADFGPKGNDVAVIETVVNGDGAPHEPSEDGPSHRCEQSILQWTRGYRRARHDVRFQPVNGDRDSPSRNQLAQAARVVWVGVGNDYASDLVAGEAERLQPPRYRAQTPTEPRVDQ